MGVHQAEKEVFWAWLAGKYGKAADRRSRRAANRAVTEAKTLVWEEFGEVMERAFIGPQEVLVNS